MKWPNLARRISSRLHMALGLAALTVGAVLSATYIGLIPDGEALTRQHRAALAETVAVTVSSLLDESQPEGLRQTLAWLAERQPALRSLGLRAADGTLLIALQDHAAHWTAGPDAASTDAEVMVPVWQAGEPWGRLELRFEPLRASGWRGHLQDPSVKLSGFLFVVCVLLFAGYLRRMLRELDPSRAVPQRVRIAYDTLAEGLIVIDAKGAIVLANQSTALLLGVDEQRLMARSPSDFTWRRDDGSTIARADLPWQQTLATRQAQRDQHLVAERADGVRFALRANCSPILDGRDGIQAVVVSFQDITELERRGDALRVAKEQADAANEAKSQFLANMSHEIRTPMNAILGFTEVLRRSGAGNNPADAAKHLDIIHSSGRHLLNLINDILDLSKVEAGRVEAERLPFAPHQVAREVVHTLADRAAQKGLSLRLEFPQALPAQIDGDAARLRQILTNLIGNAIKFTTQGSVVVALRLDQVAGQPRYCIDVRDSGIGIAADKLESVFEPFVQAETSTTRRFGGTGLGLTISRGFARAMGGDIIATSTAGQGTTFSVWLHAPDLSTATLLPPEQLAVAHAASAPVAAVRWQFAPAHVLVVDDGSENRQLVRVLLEDAGLRVSEAEDGQVALDRVAAEPFDLLLMDMQMPVMDGQTATRKLRELGCTLPIVALTANAMKGFERELIAAGFSGYLTKPIDVDALLADLAQRLGATALQPGSGAAGAEPAPAPATPITSSAPPAAPAQADLAPMRSRLAGHAKLGRIVARFVDQLPAKLAQMDAAAASADMAELAALAHWLKGAGGSMGFDALYEPAKALEDAAHTDQAALAGTIIGQLHRLGQAIQRGAELTTTAEATA